MSGTPIDAPGSTPEAPIYHVINKLFDYGDKHYIAEPEREVEFNGIKFVSQPGAQYLYDYVRFADDITNKVTSELGVYRFLILNDLWFLVYFVMGVSVANHPFWVNTCREIQKGPRTNTLDLWSRDHGKSTCITVGETIQDLLRSHAEDGPRTEERIVILSYNRALAKSFLRVIKELFENSLLLKQCFPDVLFNDPKQEASKWSEDGGLRLKRRGTYKEESLEAWGLTDGMPTGKHFTKRVYDDVVTLDLVQTADMMEKVKTAFDMSRNIGTKTSRARVIGTYYHHDDPLVYIGNKKYASGVEMFTRRLKPATHDGTFTGDLVYYPIEAWQEIMTGNLYHIGTQQLLNPTPQGTQELNSGYLKLIEQENLPENLYKFIIVDSAGTAGKRADGKRADDWAIHLIGVEPFRDSMGASNIYLLDSVIDEIGHEAAMREIVEMYSRAGYVQAVAIEKVGAMSMEIHVANALRARKKFISVESNSLIILRPSGRKKQYRIANSLDWPLRNGKIHISSAVPRAIYDRLCMEMDKFPQWRDDGLDALSYIYDILSDYRFPDRPNKNASKVPWWRQRTETKFNWRTG